MPFFKPSRRRESLFGHRRRDHLSFPSLLRTAVVLAVLLVIVWMGKDQAAFYSALYRGRRAVSRGNFAQAQKALERAWQKKPGHPYVLDGAGFLFLHQQAGGWKEQARENYAKAVAAGLRRNPFINHVKEARHLLDAGRYDLAEVELAHALMLFPRDATCSLLAGHLLYARGKLPEAIEQYEKAMALSKGSAEVEGAIARAQEARSRGSVSYILDRHGRVLAGRNIANDRSVYPCDFWAAHVTGYRSAEHGTAGIEAALGDRLAGNTVTLTVDAQLQRIADAALGWQKGAIVVLKPDTGEILAAVSHPAYRPSQIDKSWWKYAANPNKPLRNRVMESLYEPGSIAKIISSAAVIETKINVDKLFPFRCRGHHMIKERTFWDWTGHGKVSSFSDAFNKSCNVAMARIAPQLGAANLTQYLRSFGFGEQDRITLELPVAESRAPINPDDPYKLAEACSGLGNNFRITPLHAAMIAAAVANGGVMMAPSIVKEIRSVTGTAITRISPKVYQISVKKETAAHLTRNMMNFVKSGIGQKARMIRYNVAGKTGTSGSPKDGLHGWFICFAPAEKPQLAVAVLCENGGTGHGVAAPVAKRVLAEALR